MNADPYPAGYLPAYYDQLALPLAILGVLLVAYVVVQLWRGRKPRGGGGR